MINSKETILNKLRKQTVSPAELPDMSIVHSFNSSGEFPIDRFSTVLQSVGGKAVTHSSINEAEQAIIEQGVSRDLKNALCLTDTVFIKHEKAYQTLDPRALACIKYAIIDAQFGVAENGSVWINEPLLAHRSTLFIVEHLIVLLKESNLVENMHEAYAILSKKHVFGKPSFGCFISGPSKTADIEQSLVIGAHGTRTHTAYLLCS